MPCVNVSQFAGPYLRRHYKGGPHGCNLSHAKAFNQALLDFLRET